MAYTYQVSYAISANGPWTSFNTVSATTDTVTGLAGQTAYFFQIITIDSAGIRSDPVITGPYTTTSSVESAQGTSVTTVGPNINASPTPGSAGSGNIFAITSNGQISYNGNILGGSAVTQLYYINHTGYQKGSGTWWGPLTSTSTGVAVANPIPSITGINLSNASITPGAASGTVVGSLSVAFNAGTFTGTLTLAAGSSTGFAISGNNLVTNATSVSGTYSIFVTATPSGQTNGVTVPPFTTPSPFTITVSAQSATVVGLGAYTGDVSAGAGPWQTNQAVFAPKAVKYFTTYIDEAQQSSTWASYAEFVASTMNVAGLNAASGTIPQMGWGLGTSPEGALFSQIIAGNYDTAFRSAVASFASKGWTTIVIRIGWEMNIGQPWAVNSGNASQYVAAWQHMASVLHSAAATNGITVLCNWCPNVGVNQNDGSVSLAQMYPGNIAVDMLGIDTYDQPIGGPVPGGTDTGGFNYLVNTMFSMGAANNKPVSFGEVGITTTSWANALVNCCNSRPAGVVIAFVGWWDVNLDGNYKFSGGGNAAVTSILQAGFGSNGSVHN